MTLLWLLPDPLPVPPHLSQVSCKFSLRLPLPLPGTCSIATETEKWHLLPRSFMLQIPNSIITWKLASGSGSEELQPKQTLKPETLLFDRTTEPNVLRLSSSLLSLLPTYQIMSNHRHQRLQIAAAELLLVLVSTLQYSLHIACRNTTDKIIR